MSDVVIKVENLSKRYRLGVIGGKTLREDAQRLWAKLRGKPDPLLKVDQLENLQTQNSQPNTPDSELRAPSSMPEHIWALRDINFEVKQGEILGIIGKNGAGKSTLLKIISKITAPTSGEIKIKGRVGSLLEVGTGFHPELTGRENIFLNGAILGMTKDEISNRFEEIVEFSGVTKYIDTPVKRYSSGMYVRLAFAVAAHLDPEILLIDEVLAVGDAIFQRKALGKIKDISKEQGRTVIFVSHNMNAVKNLCTKALLLDTGAIVMYDRTEIVVDRYLSTDSVENVLHFTGPVVSDEVTLLNASLDADKPINNGNALVFKADIEVTFAKPFATILYIYRNQELAFIATDYHKSLFDKIDNTGKYTISFKLPPRLLNPGYHSISLAFTDYFGNHRQLIYAEDIIKFRLEDDGVRRGNKYNLGWEGAVSPLIQSEISPCTQESWKD